MKTQTLKRHLPLAAGLLGLSAAGVYAMGDPEAKEGAIAPATLRPRVATATLEPESVRLPVRGVGRLKATRALVLTAPVEGRVTFVSPSLRPGALVERGQVLLRVERAPAVAALAQARAALAQARLQVAEAQAAAAQARAESVGPAVTSPLALGEPQLALARHAEVAAHSAVRVAELRLGRTAVRAPFDAALVAAEVSKGQRLELGQPIATLHGTAMGEVEVPMDPRLRGQLGAQAVGQVAELRPVAGEVVGAGRLVRLARHLDPDTGAQAGYVEVPRPLELGLLFGALVEVRLEGREVEGVLRVPESALAANDVLWFVDAQDSLRKAAVEVLAVAGEDFIVRAPSPSRLRVALRPDSSFLVGAAVRPYAASEAHR